MEDEEHKDFAFNLSAGEVVAAHKFILSSRSDYFKQQFLNRWKDRRKANIASQLVTLSHSLFVIFIYVDIFERLTTWLWSC